MDWGTQRKFNIIIVLISIVLIGFGVTVYRVFFTQPETCFDRIQNQDERGVDCGGVCELVCANDVTPLIILWQRPVLVSGDVYSAVVYVANENKNAGIKQLDYEIKLYDDKNILVGAPITGTTFVGPLQKKAIVETGIVVENRIPKTVFTTFSKPIIWSKTSGEQNNNYIESINETISDSSTFPKLSALLQNTNNRTDYIDLPVIALVYDTIGNIMAVSKTTVDRLDHGKSEMVYFTWQRPFMLPVGTIELLPLDNPFTQ